jgi:hypothetical protein
MIQHLNFCGSMPNPAYKAERPSSQIIEEMPLSIEHVVIVRKD